MKKKEFLDELEKILEKNNCSDKEEILKDFEEHFTVAMEEGKSEEEVAKVLGDPKDIAIQFISEEHKEDEKQEATNTEVVNEQTNVKKENSTTSKLLIALALIFFNMVFVVWIGFGIFAALVGCIIAFIAVSIVGIALIVAGIVGLIVGVAFITGRLMAVTWIFAGIGVTCLRNIINYCICSFKFKMC